MMMLMTITIMIITMIIINFIIINAIDIIIDNVVAYSSYIVVFTNASGLLQK